MKPRTYSAVRSAFGLMLLAAWALVVQGTGGTSTLWVVPLLCYGTLQLFEGLARYVPGPTLPEQSPIARELLAIGFSVALAFIAATSDSESDAEMPPGGHAALVLLFAAGAHFVAASNLVSVERRLVWVRLMLSFVLGVLVAVALAADARLTFLDVLGVPVVSVVVGLLTMKVSWAAWTRWGQHQRSANEPRSEVGLATRVEAAERGDGPDALLRIVERGTTFHGAEREGDALEVPVELAPEVEEGQWILVANPHIVTATRGGGDGYRGTDTYERLDGADDVMVIPELPLPPPPPRPVHPVIVEGALAFATIVSTVLAYAASTWALG